MSDEDALLAAVLAQPDEDTPRLVYADWLDEHGNASGRARAEFIRLQIESERGLADSRRKRIAARCKELERTHGKAWLAPFRAACDDEPITCVFRRGFVSDIDGTETLPGRFADIAATSPVQRVDIDFGWAKEVPRVVSGMANCAALERVRWMECRRFPEKFGKPVLASPHLTGLHTLYLQWGWLGPAVALVNQSPVARSLRHLWIWGASDEPLTRGGGFDALVDAEWPVLTQVRLDNLPFVEGQVQTVIRTAVEREWQSLHVHDYTMTQEVVTTAMELVLASKLASVSLARECDLDEPPAPVPDGVKSLALRGFYDIGDALARWVMVNVQPGRFNRLSLRQSPISLATVRALLKWPGLEHLHELDLRMTQLTDSGAATLAASPRLEKVELLRVAMNHLTQKGKDVLKKRFARRVRVADGK